MLSAQTMLNEEKLKNWLHVYNLENVKSKSVGIIAAGNIPLVSFHDVLCVLISGQKLYLKTSDRDNVLLPHFLENSSLLMLNGLIIFSLIKDGLKWMP
jgi:hypothetical protein